MNTTQIKMLLVWAAGLFLVAACSGMATSNERPDTEAKSFWSYMQNKAYRSHWDLWPGKGEKYKGIEPHGLLLTTYLNGPAIDALKMKRGAMPDGSIIIKENYMPDGKLAAITTMYKVKGYNPDQGDWYWVKYDPKGKVLKEGKPAGCIGCHGAMRGNDFIMTGKLR
ncbi:hypothetical protein BOW53_09190 [Solemya pervernicosa gill symbiont]|uniref:Cytochrome P460 domain-containing protein n=2 Tax=Gammaproteobacteria incertae sedis TaxID=118884 RepID=A0A1T2L4S1_9GAMM|nr:cytochrome P460 family protein [Candidatus Reidiella endopervernicosa]OOZ40061.1 hypothetical protein BOW53_09190 [Solemya pervernicosa gill symbiont]QKQ27645.1 cytochrome P460 family protein [Candidatus Reidiella endopervernicosa]